MPSTTPKRKPMHPRTTVCRAFRLTPAEDETLAARAAKAGVNVSQFIRLRLADDLGSAVGTTKKAA